MRVDLGQIENELIPWAEKRMPTGDTWLDARFLEDQPPYYKLFYTLSKTLHPRCVVELGTARATGAAHFHVGYPEGIVIAIDIHNSDPSFRLDGPSVTKSREVFERYPNIIYLNGYTCDEEIVAEVAKRGPIDILFIDATHEYVAVKEEERNYLPLLADEALIIYHDIFDAPGYTVDMTKVWDEVPYEKFLSHVLHNAPMGFVRYVRGQP